MLVEGSCRHFVKAFNDRYGGDSLFVRSASDVLTVRLARVMFKKDSLPRPDLIALFSDAESRDTLEALLSSLPDTVQHLPWEALGTQPIGTLGKTVDAVFGEGAFSTWLTAFQNRDFEGAARATATKGAI